MKNKLPAGFALLALLLGICFTQATAQIAISADIQGRPLMAINYTDVKGSPYLLPDWNKGYVKLKNGQEYDNIDLMYDQVSDLLIFKNSQGQLQEFATPAQEFRIRPGAAGNTLAEQIFVRGFAPVDGATAAAFYQVLADGELQFLKRTAKNLFEEKPYGSATTVKTFRENNFYYLAKEGKLQKIKKDRKTVLAALSAKAPEIDKYLQEAGSKFSFKDDQHLAELINHYNSLH